MIASEAQANLDIMTSIMFVFGTPIRVLLNFGSSRSFVSFSFALHADRELAPLKNTLVVMTPLREQILRNTVFKDCEVLVECVVLKANLIPLEMYDFDMILDMDWFSTQPTSVDCFTNKVVFQKPGHSELEFEGDRRVLPTCVISALEAKGCGAFLAHVVDKFSPEVTLEMCRE